MTLPRAFGRNRIKHPAKATQDDVRLCFKEPEFGPWRLLRLTEFSPLHLRTLMDDIMRRRGHRACEWWRTIKPPQPDGPTIVKMEARNEALEAAKSAFTVAHVGRLLAIHEAYCAERSGNAAISPGVRWGLWWLVLTANRRFTITTLRREDLQWIDPLNRYTTREQAWGVASWPAEFVKSKRPFMLPIPPIGLHVARSCIWDWDAVLRRKHGFRSPTQWVFASTRRPGRPGQTDNPDPALYPNSLNAHLRALRGRKRSGQNKDDLLGDLPEFWPQLIRAVTTNFFAGHRRTLPAAAASALLGHVLPGDATQDWRRMSKTTIDYYLTAQHMDLKTEAMKLWSDAVVAAYVDAGGQLPMPRHCDLSEPPVADWVLPPMTCTFHNFSVKNSSPDRPTERLPIHIAIPIAV